MNLILLRFNQKMKKNIYIQKKIKNKDEGGFIALFSLFILSISVFAFVLLSSKNLFLFLEYKKNFTKERDFRLSMVKCVDEFIDIYIRTYDINMIENYKENCSISHFSHDENVIFLKNTYFEFYFYLRNGFISKVEKKIISL